jgi:monothiol glutaredoxin
MPLQDATRRRIDELITNHRVMLFMKGDRQAPQCGFSARVIGILEGYISDYETLDVLSNADIREGIKEYSSWPTIPQLYVDGEFIGGCDIITELNANGELFETLGVEPPPEVIPKIEITDEAAEGLRHATAQNGGPDQHLHLSIDRSFQSSLSMGPRGALDVVVEANGITVMLDRLSAARADGVRIEVVDTPRGRGFRVDNPNAPTLRQMTVQELKKLRDSGKPFELIDVRTPSEYETARIEGAQLLDESLYQRLSSLPRDTRLVFICHHGPRGVNAAEQFLGLGFTDVHNVTGGIHAWSLEIDSSVPQY